MSERDRSETPDTVTERIVGVAAPSVGRIVHFREHRDSPCEAAIVVWASGLSANLQVFVDTPNGTLHKQGVYFGEDAHNWHWPERNAA